MRNGQSLLQIVDEILDMSKVEAGKLTVEMMSFSLPQMLSDLENLFTPKAREKGLKLQFIYDRRLPQVIQTDPNRLRQILINVLGNAIKFTQAGSVSLIVSLLPSQEGKPVLEFTIVDTGVGISTEHQSLLFKPFSQADSSISRRFGGTGLGLALSRQLARLLQGDLVLTTSEPGKGSTFTLRLTVDMNESEKKRAEPANSQKTSRLQLSDVHVLLVDDSSDNRLLMSRILKSTGAIVDIASNGLEAIDKALHNSHDIILLDMQMPVMDGYTAARVLREKGFARPIIALTANAMNSERSRCIEAGCDDFHPKPIDRPLLIDLICNYVTADVPHAR
jgi:CheY-like chemotaxis protein